MDIGKNLKNMRKINGLSQVELAEKTGLRQSTISCIEKGTNKPAIETIMLLASAMDCSVSEIIGDSRKPEISINAKEKELLSIFDQFNSIGKQRAIETLMLMTNLPEYKKKDIQEKAI